MAVSFDVLGNPSHGQIMCQSQTVKKFLLPLPPQQSNSYWNSDSSTHTRRECSVREKLSNEWRRHQFTANTVCHYAATYDWVQMCRHVPGNTSVFDVLFSQTSEAQHFCIVLYCIISCIEIFCFVTVAPILAIGHFLLRAWWPGTHCQTIYVICRLAKTLLGNHYRHTCLRCHHYHHVACPVNITSDLHACRFCAWW